MHPSGMTGLDLRANRLDGVNVFFLVDFGPAGTLTSPQVLKQLSIQEARDFVARVNSRVPLYVGGADHDVRQRTEGLVCAWDYSDDNVQAYHGEFLCAGCRVAATHAAHADIVSAVDD